MSRTDRSIANMRRVIETCDLMVDRLGRFTSDLQDWDGDQSEVRRLLGLVSELRLSADRLRRDAELARRVGPKAAQNSTRSLLAVAFQSAIDATSTEVLVPSALAVEAVTLPGSVFGVRDVLRLLMSARKTGSCTVCGDAETYTLEFDQGELIGAATDRPPPGLRIGEILVARGALTQAGLDDFLERHRDDRARIGRSLEAEELVSRAQVHAALRHQVDRLFERLLAEREADVSFMPVPPAPHPEGLTFDLAELLLSR